MHIIYFRADPHCPITFINKRQISCICQMIVKLSGLKKKWRINVKSAEEGTIVSLPLCSSPTHRSNSTQKFSFEQKQKHVSLSSVCCTNFNPSQLIRVKYHLWVISKKKKKKSSLVYFYHFLLLPITFTSLGLTFPIYRRNLAWHLKTFMLQVVIKRKVYFQLWKLGELDKEIVNFSSWPPLWKLDMSNLHFQSHSYKHPFPTINTGTTPWKSEVWDKRKHHSHESTYLYLVWLTISFCINF